MGALVVFHFAEGTLSGRAYRVYRVTAEGEGQARAMLPEPYRVALLGQEPGASSAREGKRSFLIRDPLEWAQFVARFGLTISTAGRRIAESAIRPV